MFFTPSFLPSKEQAISLQTLMNDELLRSLTYLADYLVDKNYIEQGEALKQVTLNLRQQSVIAPEVYGYYYALAFKMLSENFNDIENEINGLKGLSLKQNLSFPIVCALDDEDFKPYKDMCLARLGESDGFHLSSPVNLTSNYQKTFNEALGLLKKCIPHLYEEFLMLVKRVVIVGDENSIRSFDGAAVFQLWGLLFIHEDKFKDVYTLLETLIHESAHIFLFGFTFKEPLTLNSANERYFSAIRGENRPIDGVFHALVVNARVIWAFEQILKNGIENSHIQHIQNLINRHQALLQAHFDVVEKNAVLSLYAKSILDSLKVETTFIL